MSRFPLVILAGLIGGCGGAPVERDAAHDSTRETGDDARDASEPDARPFEGCERVCFEWDGWPAGDAAYRVDRERCNFGGASAGTCPRGFECGEPIPSEFDALTRLEPVCEPTGAGTIALDVLVGADPPDLRSPVDVRLDFRITRSGADGWPETAGDVRIVDASGVERFAGPVPPGGRLDVRLDRGAYALAARFGTGDGEMPPWFRTGRLRVATAGVAEVRFEAGAIRVVGLAEGDTLRLRSPRVGAVRLDRPERSLVPGAYTAQLEHDARDTTLTSAALPAFEIVESTLTEVVLDSPVLALEGEALLDGLPFSGEVRFVDLRDGRVGGVGFASGGRYDAEVFAGQYTVFAGPRTERGLARDVDVTSDAVVDLELTRVPFVGEVRLDGVRAPGAATRLGYLALHDALGAAVPGVDVRGSDAGFDALVPDGRFDVLFVATSPAMPPPGAVVARGVRPGERLDLDVRSAVLTVDFEGASDADARATLRIRHPQIASLAARIEIVSGEPVVVAEGSWRLSVQHARFGELELGEVELSGDVRLPLPLRAREVEVRVAGLAEVAGDRGVIRFVAHESTPLSPSPFEVTLPGDGPASASAALLPGVYTISRTCLPALGCGSEPVGDVSERLFGWLRIE